MERLLQKIGAWAQIVFSCLLVTFSGFNFARALTGWHDAAIVVMFTALLAACIALLVFSVRDYQRLLRKHRKETKLY